MSEAKYGRCDTCGALCNENGCRANPHHQIANPTSIPAAQAEPVEAKEPWKPKVGEKGLVEAEFRNLPAGLLDSATVHVIVGGISAFPSFAQLRPLPVVQGEGAVK